MLFQTPTFWLFLVLVVAGAALLGRWARANHLFLLAASYIFYAAWDWRFLGLILFSTVLDYAVGLGIQRCTGERARKWLLAASVGGNIGVLGLFKYHDFFAENLNALLGQIGLAPSIPLLHVILPVGISFYTFQTLSYTIDIYRGDLEARTNFVQVALFVAFFPQLVAGPIVRAREFLPQLDHHPSYNPESAATGLYLILQGLTKKVVFADVIGGYLVNPVWGDPGGYGWAWILLAAWGFKFQIYGDFSGYSDIAIGCGRLLGFELPQNFNSPFKAHSNADYWRRWHMTLGSWFRDYVFFPIGGSRMGMLRTNANILFTMMLVGLWHGAAWTFVIWGTMHGVYLVVERIFRARLGERSTSSRSLHVLKVFTVFQLGALSTMVFRAPGLEALGEFLAGFARATEGLGAVPLGVWVALILAVLTHYAPERLKVGCQTGFARLPAALQAAAVVGCLWLVRFVGSTLEPFYYFQF